MFNGCYVMITEAVKENIVQKINPPVIIINCKAYKEAIGEQAIRLTEIVEEIANDYTSITFAIAVQPTDIFRVAQIVSKTLVFAQHIDPVHPGAFTGSILPEAIKLSGARGTLINHSEKQLPMDKIKKTLERAREVGLITTVCADSPEKSFEVARYKPDFVAYEPPELIGTGISVSKAKPDILRKAVIEIEKGGEGMVIPLCGAGISTKEDVVKALELGTKGILVASAVVKAKDPFAILQGFADGIMEYIEQV